MMDLVNKKHYRAVILVLASNNHEIYRINRKIWKKYMYIDPSIKVYFTYDKLDSTELEDFDPQTDFICPEIEEKSLIVSDTNTSSELIQHDFIYYEIKD